MSYDIKTITEVRKSFWEAYPEFKPEFRVRKRQKDYNATIRTEFSFYVDMLARNNQISDKLAKRVTL